MHKEKDLSIAVTGPMWPRRWVELQLYSSMTAVTEGVSGQKKAPAGLYPGKDTVSNSQEAGWAARLV